MYDIFQYFRHFKNDHNVQFGQIIYIYVFQAQLSIIFYLESSNMHVIYQSHKKENVKIIRLFFFIVYYNKPIYTAAFLNQLIIIYNYNYGI